MLFIYFISGIDVMTWCYLFIYFIFIMFINIIFLFAQMLWCKLCYLVNSLICLMCTDVVMLGIITLVCTDVMLQGHYLFIFSSGMDCNNLSHRCGRLYFPMFLFNVGLLSLMYMASFTALAILWSSLPIILKFSTDVIWPVLFWCSCIGNGAFRCWWFW